ncbi:MAG: UPF0280 family protein [Pseudomonadota bacterium]
MTRSTREQGPKETGRTTARPALGDALSTAAAPAWQPASAHLLPGDRLHLQHGPIDLIITAEGRDRQARPAAFSAANRRFATLLAPLASELTDLRKACAQPGSATDVSQFTSPVAQRMDAAARPHAAAHFITPMAAVAGAVADEILAAMRAAAPLTRAAVNNGGDIALCLAPDQQFVIRRHGLKGADEGLLRLRGEDLGHTGQAGIATSGRGGRSHSMGIADSVTVLASSAAAADAAATLIANAVDLGAHPGITRAPASTLNPESDLGERLVVTDCAPLAPDEKRRALAAGLRRAKHMQRTGLIEAALLTLQGEHASLGRLANSLALQSPRRRPAEILRPRPPLRSSRHA